MSNTICRIQYTSGLFVDLFEKTVGVHFVKPVAPILVLNGNIGRPDKKQTYDFIKDCSKKWSTVYYIPGKYEMDNSTIGFMRYKYSGLHNVIILHNEARLHSGTLFLGTSNDMDWLKQWSKLITPATGKIVALTHVSPTSSSTYLPFSAWICGDKIGGKKFNNTNNILVAYNGRGRINGINDFGGIDGWTRDASLIVPELSGHELGEHELSGHELGEHERSGKELR